MNINEYNYNMELIDLLPDVANVLYNERIVQQREEIKRLKEELRQLKEKRVICFKSFDEIGYITIYPNSILYNASLQNIALQVLFDFSKDAKYKKFEYSLPNELHQKFLPSKILTYNIDFEMSSTDWTGNIFIYFMEIKPDCHSLNTEYYINHKSYGDDSIFYKFALNNG